MTNTELHEALLHEITQQSGLLPLIRVGKNLPLDKLRLNPDQPPTPTTSIFYESIGDHPEAVSYAIIRIARELGRAVVSSVPKDTLTREIPAMTGILSWPQHLITEDPNFKVFLDMGKNPLTKPILNSVISNLWDTEHADFTKGNWVIACHPTRITTITDFDPVARHVKFTRCVPRLISHADIGADFILVSDRQIPPDTVLILDADAPSYGFIEGDTARIITHKARTRHPWRGLTCQTYGVAMRNPRASIAMITNIGV